MAWDRTALILIVHGALLVIHEPGAAGPARIAPAAASLALALVAALLGRLRAREIAGGDVSRRVPVPRRALVILTLGVLVIAALDVLAVARS